MADEAELYVRKCGSGERSGRLLAANGQLCGGITENF